MTRRRFSLLGIACAVALAVALTAPQPAQAAAYSSQFIRQSTAPSINSGGQATLYVDFKNIGTSAWLSTGANPIRLGTSHPLDRTSPFYANSWLAAARATSFIGTVDGGGNVTNSTTVAPGETARFQFQVIGPLVNQATTYKEYFQLVAEGIQWMEDYGQHFPITVSSDIAFLSPFQTFGGGNTFSQLLTANGGIVTNNTAINTGTGVISGNGSGLNSVNALQLGGQNGAYYQDADNLNAGTVADARLSSNVTKAGNTFNGNSQLVQLTGSGALPAIDGSALTGVVTLAGDQTLAGSKTFSSVIVVGSGVNVHLAGSGNTMNAITKDFPCTSTELVNHIVAADGDGIVVSTASSNDYGAIGVVVSKPNATLCTVAIAGMVQVWFSTNPATIGEPVVTSGVTGAAMNNTSGAAGVVGVATSTKDGSDLVWVLLR